MSDRLYVITDTQVQLLIESGGYTTLREDLVPLSKPNTIAVSDADTGRFVILENLSRDHWNLFARYGKGHKPEAEYPKPTIVPYANHEVYHT